MEFNKLAIINPSDFKLVRYLATSSLHYKYVALYQPTKKFVVIDERREMPGSNKIEDSYAKLLYDMGPQDNVITFLGFAHLDGRTYLATKQYELGTLGAQLEAYEANCISPSSENWVLLYKQFVLTAARLLNLNIYPHLNPSTIFLEEKVGFHYPEIFIVDSSGLQRKARVNIRLAAVEELSQVAAPPLNKIKVSDGYSGRPKTADGVLTDALKHQLYEFERDTFNPDHEPQSVGFIGKKRQKAVLENNKRLIERYRVEEMPAYLNAQNVDEKLFTDAEKSPLQVYQMQTTGEDLVMDELRQLYQLFRHVSDKAGLPWCNKARNLGQALANQKCDIQTLLSVLGDNKSEDYYYETLSQNIKPRPLSGSPSHHIRDFLKEAKQGPQLTDLWTSAEPARQKPKWRDAKRLNSEFQMLLPENARGKSPKRNLRSAGSRSASPDYQRAVADTAMGIKQNDNFGDTTRAQIDQIIKIKRSSMNSAADKIELEKKRQLREEQKQYDAMLSKPKRNVDPYYYQFSPQKFSKQIEESGIYEQYVQHKHMYRGSPLRNYEREKQLQEQQIQQNSIQRRPMSSFSNGYTITQTQNTIYNEIQSFSPQRQTQRCLSPKRQFSSSTYTNKTLNKAHINIGNSTQFLNHTNDIRLSHRPAMSAGLYGRRKNEFNQYQSYYGRFNDQKLSEQEAEPVLQVFDTIFADVKGKC